MVKTTSARTRQTVFGLLARATRVQTSRRLLDVALHLRISPSFLSDIERGVRHCPPGNLAKRWAMTLGADPRIFELATGVDRGDWTLPGDASLPALQRLEALDLRLRWHQTLTPNEIAQLLCVFDADGATGGDASLFGSPTQPAKGGDRS
jgi:hypothetical protein